MADLTPLLTWLQSLGIAGYVAAALIPVVLYLVKQRLGPATPTPAPSPSPNPAPTPAPAPTPLPAVPDTGRPILDTFLKLLANILDAKLQPTAPPAVFAAAPQPAADLDPETATKLLKAVMEFAPLPRA